MELKIVNPQEKTLQKALAISDERIREIIKQYYEKVEDVVNLGAEFKIEYITSIAEVCNNVEELCISMTNVEQLLTLIAHGYSYEDILYTLEF